MHENIKVMFLANAAILLEYEETKILIDGIYDEYGHSFSSLSSEQWNKLKCGRNGFSDIAYLLFTHDHSDHFSPLKVKEYLKYQIPKAIFIPKVETYSIKLLCEEIKRKHIFCILLEELCQKVIFEPEKNVSIKVFQTKHLGKNYENMPHYCYLLRLGHKNILFTGDMDFTKEKFEELENISLDAVFINPLLFCSKEGEDMLSKLSVKKKIIYHIPFEEDDKMEIRKILDKKQVLNLKKENDTICFLERDQICFI